MRNKAKVKGLLLLATALLPLAGCVIAPPRPPPPPPPPPAPAHHPAYLHALSDLRAARWLIEHRPGNWAQTNDEVQAVQQIDAAINEIKHASVDDGKNLNDHPPVDEAPEHHGRIRAALQYLRKARADISQEDDNGWANGLRERAYQHIDLAIQASRRVFKD
jgi:hypothetical protein